MILSFFMGILLLSFIGFSLGLFLSFISNFFSVKSNPIVDDINNILPGINCGACGYPGCAGYALALAKDDNTAINLCSPGGKSLSEKLGNILGRNADFSDKFVAKVFCMGDDSTSEKDYDFNGEDDCNTLANFFLGDKSCKYGCLGKGDCVKVCPVNAIKRDSLNRIWIDSNECVGCKKCISVCPKSVIKMVPINGGHFVACSSHDTGKVVREVCKKGCIACKICEKVMMSTERIKVTDNLAEVSYSADSNLHNAALKCPPSVIIPIENQKAFVLDIVTKELNSTKIDKATGSN